MIIQKYGYKAILVSFEQKIEPHLNAKVIHLKNLIEKAKLIGINYCIPAYCSLVIGFEPHSISYEDLTKKVKSWIDVVQNSSTQINISDTIHSIPVCYDKLYALDLEILTKQTGCNAEELIKLHTKQIFRVYMLGFLPGFIYLGKLPESLFCKRKQNPRTEIAAGSVGIAGYQTGIYPFKSPGGWQIIGRTPLKIFDISKTNPFLFKAGDSIRFYSISKQEFEKF